MATAVVLPKVDMDQETGTVVEWLKRDGDLVKAGEPILVIETDKVSIEVEAPASGILRGIQAQPDDVIPVGTVIAYILEPDEKVPGGATRQDASKQLAKNQRVTSLDSSTGTTVTPITESLAADHEIELATTDGTGPRGKVTKRDVKQVSTMTPEVKGDGKVNASPVARRIAREHGVDLNTVTGSGPGGRITADDVLAVPVTIPDSVSVSDAKVIPLRGMRRTIAERMTASYQAVPHITLTVSVDMSRFDETRTQLNVKAEAAGHPRVSITALLVRAVAWALNRHPFLNSTLQDDGIHLLSDANIGVAVALAEGLIVPVVHNAGQKGIGEIASEVNDLTTRARQEQLTPADVAGGTFTISNLGPFGIEQFTAIINPPQAAILSVGAVRLEAVVGEGVQIVVRPIMRMTLSADHRVVDGAVAAHFLTDLRDALKSPELLL
ncbi:MAG: dehydrogenase [Dehalococcoidales bacterium]|jgi:pyruvate dehydrogenase E2 component (dihydrolipoamide acetyltransferase)|nr:dehydrogenase [Dehalococcoidales bacterium]HJO32687.1 2-oxo acid dehydrogenase subunit E2 [Anaerolineales bacterium]